MRALEAAKVIACLGALLGGITLARAEVPAFYVIVNTSNNVSSLPRERVADLFLKKSTRWSNNEVVTPIDQGSTANTRQKFCEDVLKRSVAAVRSYWQQVIFSGRDVPPPELESDAAVIKYVMKHSGAIGYVSGGVDISGVRVVALK